MSIKDVIKISAIRQQFGLGERPTAALPLSIGEVYARFGLEECDSALPANLDCAKLEVTLDKGSSAGIVPVGSSSSPMPSIEPVENRDGLDAIGSAAVLDTSGDDTMPFNELTMTLEDVKDAELKVQAAMELARGKRAAEREITHRAIIAYYRTPRYREMGKRLQTFVDDARTEIRTEQAKQEILDFVAGFKADLEKSELT